MKISRGLRILLVVTTLAAVLQVIVAEVLEDSGYPMFGVNPQRNYQSNRRVLCSRAPGRSQVLNVKWRYKPSVLGTFLYNSDGFTIDSAGNVQAMVYGLTSWEFIKLNGTDGSVIDKFAIGESNGLATPTLVQGNKMYFATQANTYIVDTQTMSITGSAITNTQGGSVPGLQLSYAPYLGTHMVASNRFTSGLASTESLMYIQVADRTVDSTQFNVAAGSPQSVLIYKDNTNEFPIVVSFTGLNPNTIVSLNSPNYSVNVTQGEVVHRAWIEGSSVFIYTTDAIDVNTISVYEYNALTGALIEAKTISTFQSNTFVMQSEYYGVNGKSVAQIYNNVAMKSQVVDLLSGRILLQAATDMLFENAPLYSKPDNTMIMQVAAVGDRLELIGLDWDTFEINTRGGFPSDLVFTDIAVGPVLLGEDCHVYSTFNAELFAFAPVPVLDIVPIFECVNEDGIAYFSYENLGDIEAIIPQLIDRNFLSPLNVTPGVDFAANRRGKYFPLSFRVNFGTTGTFTWQLEDYVLTLTLNASLACPRTVRFKIFLRATEPFPFSFVQSVRLLFASLAGINETRVTQVFDPKVKRFAEQATDLELELEVAPPDSQNEPTSEQAVQNFVEQQLDNFNNQLGGLPDAPANVTTTDVDGVPLPTEILGEKLPPMPLAAQPGTDTTPPTYTPFMTSSGVAISGGSVLLFVFAISTSLGVRSEIMK